MIAEIKTLVEEAQNRAYYFYTNELNTYFSLIWDHMMTANPEFGEAVQ